NMRKTMAELDEALGNRDALAAIAVFRSQDQAPTAVPFAHFDDKAIAVLDPDDEDESALRLAYMWARWTVRKGLAVGDEADVVLIDKTEGFVFGFSKLDVMFGRTTADAVFHPYADIVKPGVRFVRAAIQSIDPIAKRVETDAGTFEGDILVIGLGADL